jgi:uridine kinase
MGALILGIAGGTGSGKTTIAKKVSSSLPSGAAAIIEHDWYYRDRSDLSYDERTQLNYDHPDSLETELLIEHIRALREGQAVEVPQYDFKTHARMAKSKPIVPPPVVIVEGILTFVNPKLRSLLDIKIFVDTDSDIRAFRRIRRDIEHRGRDFQSIREQYYSTVRPMHLEFVKPSKRWADIIIPEGGDNNVAIDLLIVKLGQVLQGAGDAKVAE